jgi:hypothetical protein
MPWSAYDSSGRLRIGMFDRSVDPANHKYGYSLATETGAGALKFTTGVISTATFDPTTGDRWVRQHREYRIPVRDRFTRRVPQHRATADGGVVAYWIHMRNDATFADITGRGEDALLRESQLTGDLQPGGHMGGGKRTPPPSAPSADTAAESAGSLTAR